MAEREKITDGPNERAVNETIAGTAPGIPDEALAPGQELPDPPSDEEVARIRIAPPMAPAASASGGFERLMAAAAASARHAPTRYPASLGGDANLRRVSRTWFIGGAFSGRGKGPALAALH